MAIDNDDCELMIGKWEFARNYCIKGGEARYHYNAPLGQGIELSSRPDPVYARETKKDLLKEAFE